MSNWSLVDHLTDQLLKPKLGDPKPPSFWPSEASAVINNDYEEVEVVGRCRRATWFRWLIANYKFYSKYSVYKSLIEELNLKTLPTDKYLLWIWRAGDLYEEYITSLAKESGVYIGSQIPIYIPNSNISGKIDLVVINPESHKYSIVEAKSVYGFGGNSTLGTPSERAKGKSGKPKESNLMQAALYEWWFASQDETFENTRLVYGSRDTGRNGEYLISTPLNKETKQHEIFYKSINPNVTTAVNSKISIENIFSQFQYINNSLDSGTVPKRDFDLQYSEEYIDKLYERDELTKTEKEKYEKYQAYKKGESKRKIKPIIKGHWQCGLCSFKNICYISTDETNENYGKPRTL